MTDDSVLVAIDTSSEKGSVALARAGRIVAEYTWHVGHNHTAETLPALGFLLAGLHQSGQSEGKGKPIDSAEGSPSDTPQAGPGRIGGPTTYNVHFESRGAELSLQKMPLRGVAVAIGPGSFNGLRVGLGLAKGVAFAADVPIVGVGTLEVAAYGQASTMLPICALQDAGRGEIAAAIYQRSADAWAERMAPEILTLDQLLARVAEPTVFCGELTTAHRAEIKNRLGGLATVVSPAAALRRAGFLAELGTRRLEAGQVDDVATLQPLYLRRPPISRPRHPLSRGS